MKTTLTLLSFAVLLVLSPAVGIGQTRQPRHRIFFTGAASPDTKPGVNLITTLQIDDVDTGLHVRITSDTPLNDPVSYRSGERYIIVLPQAQAATTQCKVNHRGLVDLLIEQRGEDVVLIFRLEANVNPRFVKESNSLDVNFDASPQVAPLSGVTRSESVPDPAPSIMSSPDSATRATTVPASTPQLPIGGDLLKSFFGRASAETPNLDLSVPESPAFTVLGLTPQTVTRPTSPRDFVTSILSGVDDKGNFQSGIAFDAAPYMVFAGPGLTLRDYNNKGISGYLTRLFARTQVSFATTKGASEDDKSSRLALGLNLTLFDNGDPRVYRPNRGDDDVLQCFANHLSFGGLIIPPGTTEDQLARMTEGLLTSNTVEADKCRERARKANWNKSSWIVAFAPSWISTTGATKDYLWNGGGMWTSLAYGFEGVPGLEKYAQLILHGRIRSNEQVADPDATDQFFPQDSRFFGARFRAGTRNTNASVEGVYIRSRRDDNPFDSSFRMSLGFERRINSNIWLSLAFGGNSGTTGTKDNTFVISSLKWGLSRKPEGNEQ